MMIKTTISRYNGESAKITKYEFFDRNRSYYDNVEKGFGIAGENAERYREAIKACHPFDPVTITSVIMNCTEGSFLTTIDGEELIHMEKDNDDDES